MFRGQSCQSDAKCQHGGMTIDTIEAHVIEFVATSAEVKPEQVLLTSRVLHDLGIDGDDAVELFTGLHERFGTDFTHLYEHWSEHFGPEGIPLSVGLVIIPAAIVGGIVTRNSGMVASVTVTLALVVMSLWVVRRLWPVKVKPITVGEIVRAVEAGSWPV